MPTCRLVSGSGSKPAASPDGASKGFIDANGSKCFHDCDPESDLTHCLPCLGLLVRCMSNCVSSKLTVRATSISAKNLPGHLQQAHMHKSPACQGVTMLVYTIERIAVTRLSVLSAWLACGRRPLATDFAAHGQSYV